MLGRRRASTKLLRGLRGLLGSLGLSCRGPKVVRCNGSRDRVVVAGSLGAGLDDQRVGTARGDLRDLYGSSLNGGEQSLTSREEGDLLAVLDALTRDLDVLSGLEDLLAQSKSGEGNHGKLRVAIGAALNQRRSQRVRLIEVRRDVVRGSEAVRQSSRLFEEREKE